MKEKILNSVKTKQRIATCMREVYSDTSHLKQGEEKSRILNIKRMVSDMQTMHDKEREKE